MELYTLYYNIATFLNYFFSVPAVKALFFGMVISLIIWSALFVLQGFGLLQMAKNQNLKHKWLVFVPFANLLYVGKLTGECTVFGHRMKNAGLYAMIAQIVTTVFCVMTAVAEYYLYLNHGTPDTHTTMGSPAWTGLTGFSLTVYKFYDLSGYFLSIFQLICSILLLILFIGLYKKYSPKNYFALGLLLLVVPASRCVVAFVLRNKQPVDYAAYMRARQEAYMRQRQQYGNPYQNPYGGYGSPYGNPYQNSYGNPNSPQKPSPEDEPFAEFSSGRRSEQNRTDERQEGEGVKDEDFFD